MVWLVDNYDSFTYNLVSYFNEAGEGTTIYKNDKTSRTGLSPDFCSDFLCISPGPGSPSETAAVRKILKTTSPNIPILGICLGHQVLGEFFGNALTQSAEVFHGKVGTVFHTSKGIFSDMPQGFSVARYHSLTLGDCSIPDDLEVTAWTPQNEIMGLRHRSLPAVGIQFHPESLFSQLGRHLISNFILTAGAS